MRIDHRQLALEISSVEGREWLDHPNHFKGNSALPLVSANGKDNHDLEGAMMLCPRTDKMPYLRQVLADLNTSIGRCRFMRLDAGASVPRHSDTNLYWRNRARIHIPIVTNDTVLFESGGQWQHLGLGEAWVIDTWHNHSVINRGAERIHLVVDTLGTRSFWHTLETQAWKPIEAGTEPPASFVSNVVRFDKHAEQTLPSLVFEDAKPLKVLDPPTVKEIITSYINDIPESTDKTEADNVDKILRSLIVNWATIWNNFGVGSEHYVRYHLIVKHAVQQLDACDSVIRLKTNRQPVANLLKQLVANLDSVNLVSTEPAKESFQKPVAASFLSKKEGKSIEAYRQLSFEPIFVVAAPRSGSTLLFETLGLHEELMHYDSESHHVFEAISSLTVRANGSNALNEKHANKLLSNELKQLFLARLNQKELSQKRQITFLEKTPKNALRIDFLKAVFPNSRFIYLFRKPEGNISSIIDGWKSQRFVTYRSLPNWDAQYKWSFLLPEGWQELPRDNLARIAAYQYHQANQSIIDSLKKLQKSTCIALSYEEFIQHPKQALERLSDFLCLPWSSNFDQQLARENGLKASKYTLEPPDDEKWLRNKKLMQAVLPEMRDYYDQNILTAATLINSNLKYEKAQ